MDMRSGVEGDFEAPSAAENEAASSCPGQVRAGGGSKGAREAPSWWRTSGAWAGAVKESREAAVVVGRDGSSPMLVAGRLRCRGCVCPGAEVNMGREAMGFLDRDLGSGREAPL